MFSHITNSHVMLPDSGSSLIFNTKTKKIVMQELKRKSNEGVPLIQH